MIVGDILPPQTRKADPCGKVRRFRTVALDDRGAVVLLYQEYRIIRQQRVQAVHVVRHVDNALVLQETDETPDLTGEAWSVRLVQGKALTATPMLLETSDDSVIDGRYRDALLFDPEQEMASGSFVKRC
jgi:hypothetical protein